MEINLHEIILEDLEAGVAAWAQKAWREYHQSIVDLSEKRKRRLGR